MQHVFRKSKNIGNTEHKRGDPKRKGGRGVKKNQIPQ